MKNRMAILVQPGKFEIQTRDIELPPDHVMVEMAGCGLCTWELNHWQGRLGPYPQPLGHEGWGKVVEVGKACTGRIKIGDRVTGLGASNFADYFTSPERLTMLITNPKQKEIPGEPLYCVQNVVRTAHPEVGDVVAVVGCGPMGLWVIQGMTCPQLKHLIAIDIDDKKLELAKKFGATKLVNPKKTNLLEYIKGINEGRLADVAVEGTGGEAGIQTAIDVLRPKNPKLVVMSSFKGKIGVDLPAMTEKAIDMLVAHPGHAKDVEDNCRRTETLINNEVFKTEGVISHRFKLENIMDAFKALESRPEGFLKGVVVR